MKYGLFSAIVLVQLISFNLARIVKKPIAWQERPMSTKYSNVDNIRDREKNNFRPPQDEAFANRFKGKFSPSWMDYCDPYHCNDHHRTRCGLNRNTMRFQFFQSGCHIALHNLCAKENGKMKFDTIETKWCTIYAMFTRSGCPDEEECRYSVTLQGLGGFRLSVQPQQWICARNPHSGKILLVYNQCHLDRLNCRNNKFNAFIETDPSRCLQDPPVHQRYIPGNGTGNIQEDLQNLEEVQGIDQAMIGKVQGSDMKVQGNIVKGTQGTAPAPEHHWNMQHGQSASQGDIQENVRNLKDIQGNTKIKDSVGNVLRTQVVIPDDEKTVVTDDVKLDQQGDIPGNAWENGQGDSEGNSQGDDEQKQGDIPENAEEDGEVQLNLQGDITGNAGENGQGDSEGNSQVDVEQKQGDIPENAEEDGDEASEVDKQGDGQGDSQGEIPSRRYHRSLPKHILDVMK